MYSAPVLKILHSWLYRPTHREANLLDFFQIEKPELKNSFEVNRGKQQWCSSSYYL